MKTIKKITTIIIALLIIISSGKLIYARTTEEIEVPFMGKSGKYIYYYINEDFGTENGIMRYNTKTKKQKLIFSSKINGKNTNGIYALDVKGKYIYFLWAKEKQYSAPEKMYIYRMTKNGKNIKKLALSNYMTIKGNRIYYFKHKIEIIGGEKYSIDTEKMYSMKLDGSDKRREKNVKFKGKVVYAMGIFTPYYVDRGKYRYTMSVKGIYRVNRKTKKRKWLMKLKKNEEHFRFCMSKDYILIETYVEKYDYMYTYIVKENGDGFKRLRKTKFE